MKRVRLILFFLSLHLSLLVQGQGQYKTQENIAYYEGKNLDSYQRERCVLDIYYPSDKKDFSTVIWFHGGGLTGGNKELPEALKGKGIAVIGVNYRLSPKAKVEEIIEDAAAAIAWTFKHIQEYGGSDKHLIVSGHSAGGYLGLMTVLNKEYLKPYGIDADQVEGLVPFSGQAITHFTARKEQGIPELQPTIDRLAPLYHVRKDAPPLLLITGGREIEMLGRYEENAYLARMMKLSGHQDTRLLELEGYGHDMTYPAFPLLMREVQRLRELKSSTSKD